MTNERVLSLRDWAIRISVYVFLSVTAFLMLFPFLYMFFTSLKTAQDVFNTPPRLFPYNPAMVDYNGKAMTLYQFTVNGQPVQLILDEAAPVQRYAFFATPETFDPATPRNSPVAAQLPLDQIDLYKTDEQVTLGTRTLDVYSIPAADGTTQRLVLAYRGGLNRFFDPNNPSVETFAQADSAVPVDVLTFNWGNYNAVLELRNLGRSLVNTAIVTLFVTAGQVVTSLLGGYAFSRIEFSGRNGLFFVYLGTIMIPFVVLIIPLYQLMVAIDWQNRIVALIIPWLFTAYGTFLMRQFFIAIPKDLEEAALLDGLGRFGILWRVFVPLSAPAIATQAIITFLYAWNSFVWPVVIINEGNTASHVITLSLIQLRNAAASEPNLVLTGAAIAILPPLVMFTLAQRYFIEGIASTGLK